MNRRRWVIAFLSATLLAVAMEVFAAVKDSQDTPTWTDLIVEHIHWEVFALVYGGFFLWLGVHFGVRYLRKDRATSETPPQTGPPPTV